MDKVRGKALVSSPTLGDQRVRSRRARGARPILETLERRWLPTLGVQFADGFGVTGSGFVDLEANAVANDNSGNVYVTGDIQGSVNLSPTAMVNLMSSGNRDIFLAKYDNSGGLVWADDLPGGDAGSVGEGQAIVVDSAGDVYVTGTFAGTTNFDPNGGDANVTASGQNDGFVAKYGPEGTLAWVADIAADSGSVDEGYAVAVDGSGNVVVAGSFQGTTTFGQATLSAAGQSESFVAKLDPAGQFLWARGTSGSGSSVAQTTGLAIDGSGDVISTGFYTGSIDVDPGAIGQTLAQASSRALFVQALDPNGNLVWAEGILGDDMIQANSIAVDVSGNLYLTGTFTSDVTFGSGADTTTMSAGGYEDPFVLKLSASGQFDWVNDLALTGFDFGQGSGVAVDGQGDVFVAGYYQGTMTVDPTNPSATVSSAGGDDAFVSEYDAEGAYVAAQSFGGSNFDADFGIGVNNGGLLAIAGRYTGPAAFGSTTLPAQPNRSMFIAELTSRAAPLPVPAPSVPALLATDDSGLEGDGITNVNQPHLVGTADAGATVQILNASSTVLGSATATADGTYVVQLASPIADGTYALQAQAVGVAGNLSALSAPFSLTIVTGTPSTPSAPTLLASDDSGTKGDGITNVKQPHLVGTAPVGTTVQILSASGTVLGSAMATTGGTYSVQLTSPLADGTYALRTQAVDVAGNLSALSATVSLTVVSATPLTPSAPALLGSDDSGTKGDGITNVRLPHLVGTAPVGTTIQILNASGTVLGSASATASGTYSVQPASPFADGAYTLRARTVDVAGNLSAVSAPFSLTILTAAPATPSAPALLDSDDSGAKGDGITNVRQPHLVGTAPVGMTVQILNASGAVLGLAMATTGGTYSVQLASPLADGTYAFRAQTLNMAGVASKASRAITVTIDTQPPATPSGPRLLGSAVTGTQDAGATRVRQPLLTGTATTGLTIRIIDSGGKLLGSARVGANGKYSVWIGVALTPGKHSLYARSVDAAGNLSALSSVYTLTIL